MAVLLFGAFFGFRFFITPYSMPSGSMEDTLKLGDLFISNQFYYGHSFLNLTHHYFQSHQPQRGDVIVFVYPGDKSKDFVKRCVGIPGDVIEIKNKELYLNGAKQVEPYIKHIDPILYPKGALSVDRDNFGPVTVEPGHYFVLGDNRDNSLDSRYFGQVDEKLIKGKAWVTYWSGKDHWFSFKEIH
jgi:signal peptidase I